MLGNVPLSQIWLRAGCSRLEPAGAGSSRLQPAAAGLKGLASEASGPQLGSRMSPKMGPELIPK